MRNVSIIDAPVKKAENGRSKEPDSRLVLEGGVVPVRNPELVDVLLRVEELRVQLESNKSRPHQEEASSKATKEGARSPASGKAIQILPCGLSMPSLRLLLTLMMYQGNNTESSRRTY